MKPFIRRECDVAMAIKRGLYKNCDHDCELCFCCLEIDPNGQKQHADVRRNRAKKMQIYMGDFYNEDFGD